MLESALILVAAALFGYALVARRLLDSMLTGPMLFLALGWTLSATGAAHDAEPLLHLIAEITVVIMLFADASRIDLRHLTADYAWPARMLALGLPLTVAFGAVAGLLLLPGWSVWEVATIAAILAPTDAALGQAVVSNRRVPERIRTTLEVESGLNDGLALPLILLLSCLAVGGRHGFVQQSWLWFAMEQIGFGALIGGALGWAGGRLLARAGAAGLTEAPSEGVAALALAGGCFLLADLAGGNGLVAAFIGGLAFGAGFGGRCAFVGAFMEGEGRIMVLVSFLLIGAALLPEALDQISLDEVGFILACLLVARPLAIWLSLTGAGAGAAAKLFLGWFGPRGLATALFALFVMEEAALAQGEAVTAIAVVAVAISALAHGVTAAPAARRFGTSLDRPSDVPTAKPAESL